MGFTNSSTLTPGVPGLFILFDRSIKNMTGLLTDFLKAMRDEDLSMEHFRVELEGIKRVAEADATKYSIEAILIEFVENKIQEPRVMAYLKNFTSSKDEDGYLKLDKQTRSRAGLLLQRIGKFDEREETYIRQLFFKYRMDRLIKEETSRLTTHLGIRYSKNTDTLTSMARGFEEKAKELNTDWNKEGTVRYVLPGLLTILKYFINLYESLYIQLQRLTPQMRLLPELYTYATPELKRISLMTGDQQRIEYYKFLANAYDPLHLMDAIKGLELRGNQFKQYVETHDKLWVAQKVRELQKNFDTSKFMTAEKIKWIQTDDSVLSISLG